MRITPIGNRLAGVLTLLFVWVILAKNLAAQGTECTCHEYIYLNEVGGSQGVIHKFQIDPAAGPGGAFPNNLYLREITSAGLQTDPTNVTGDPWYRGNDLPSPHGVTIDLNGYVYIGEDFLQNGQIRRLSCTGEIEPESSYVINTRGIFNAGTIDNILVTNINYPLNSTSGNPFGSDSRIIVGFNVCTTAPVGQATLGGPHGNDSFDWGLYIDPRTDLIYATNGFGGFGNRPYLYVMTLDDILNNVSVPPLTTSLPSGDVRGVTTDADGFIYVVLQDDATQNNGAVIYKYSSDGTQLLSSVEDNMDDGTGFDKAVGIVYSETLDLLFVSTEAISDDCIAVFDPSDLSYIGTAVPAPGNGANGKGIAIITECCPSVENETVSMVVCTNGSSESIFLNEIFPCSGGTICEAQWTTTDGASVYQSCDQSINVFTPGCYTFTRTSDGLNGKLCGPFTQTLNLEIITIPDATISADQTIECGDIAAALSATTNGNILRWESNTLSATAADYLWTPIAGTMNSSTYDPGRPGTTTYYRIVTSGTSPGNNANCPGGSCELPSNVVTITVNNGPYVAVTTTSASCNGNSPNNDAEINLTAISNADVVGIGSAGSTTYDGPSYDPTAADPDLMAVSSGMVNFTGLTLDTYVVRVFGNSDLCFVDHTVPIGRTPTVVLPANQVSCAQPSIDLLSGVSVTPSDIEATWTTTTPAENGTFVGGTSFGSATNYVFSSQDVSRGSVTLVLTTEDANDTCGPVSEVFTVTIVQADCGSFPWEGNE